MVKSCLTIIRANGRCYYYQYSFSNFYDIFYPFLFTILFIGKEKNLEKIIQMIMMVITEMVEIGIKTLLTLNFEVLSCLNHV